MGVRRTGCFPGLPYLRTERADLPPSAFQSNGSRHNSGQGIGDVDLRLHHLTNRLSGQAVQDLDRDLNSSETIYPGTNLRLNYELVSG